MTQHCENVAATGNHERKEEFEGALCFLTRKFVKMMLFMMDMHSILKFVSKYFQREEILIIEVEPLLQRAYIALENLRGGKGNKMLQFAETFPQSGKYKGVELNRARHQTRSKVQARMELFAIQNHSDDIDISSCLFQSYNFYVDFIIAQLKDRF